VPLGVRQTVLEEVLAPGLSGGDFQSRSRYESDSRYGNIEGESGRETGGGYGQFGGKAGGSYAEEGESGRNRHEGVEPDYLLPRLPTGRWLELRLLSTWGDRHYIGLNAIEIWVVPEPATAADAAAAAPTGVGLGGESCGRLVRLLLPVQAVSAQPDSINVLPDYHNDPRTPDKLLDGQTATRDDAHMWLAPWTPGEVVTVRVDLVAAPGHMDVTASGLVPTLEGDEKSGKSLGGVREESGRYPDPSGLSGVAAGLAGLGVSGGSRTLGLIKLWNYGKTPSRGAKQLEVFFLRCCKSTVYLLLLPSATPFSQIRRCGWMTRCCTRATPDPQRAEKAQAQSRTGPRPCSSQTTWR